MTRRDFGLNLGAISAASAGSPAPTGPVSIGSRRELFVDHELIAGMRGAELRLGTPVDGGPAIHFDRPWEGAFSACTTILQDQGRYRMYYRGEPVAGKDGNPGEVTCTAESPDGIRWSRPELNLFPLPGAPANNLVLAQQPPFSHNFSPFLDTRPGVPAGERYKALAGVHRTGLAGWVSADGIRWKQVSNQPVLAPRKEFEFDSQNLAFWSTHENRYVLYFRSWKQIGGTGYRWVSR
ncbi:MAG: hypothetical protein NTY38_13730, partial [Acidobacteria bacterium]|nr:hypothetical protein [Acidobacteriota bacterium]